MLCALFFRRLYSASSASKIRKAIVIICIVLILGGYGVRTTLRNEDWKDTVVLSKKTIEDSPLDPWAYTSLGGYLIDKGECDLAIDALRKAIALLDEYALPHELLGMCYMKKEQYHEAIKEFNKALTIDPESVECRNARGVSYAHLKMYIEAKREFEFILLHNPGEYNSRLNLAQLYECQEDYANALAQYEMLLRGARTNTQRLIAYMRIGDVYKEIGDGVHAREFYKKTSDACGKDMDELRVLAEERIASLGTAIGGGGGN